MSTTAYYPYRSEAARDSCFEYFDALAVRDWPIPPENRMVPTSFGETFVRAGGPPGAPPLVLLHGAATSSLQWAPNIKSLSAECRTYAVDQIGEFGRSTCTRPPRTFDDLDAWLNELFDGLALSGPVNLVGMSYGGAVTAHYALHFPQRVNRAILLAPGATVLRSSIEFMVRLILIMVASRKFLPLFMRWIFADMARHDPKWIDSSLELLFTNIRNLQHRQLPFPKVLTDAEWAAFKVPALFLVGENEKIYSPEKAVRRLRRVAPQVIAEIVPGAGHDLTFVQAELVNQRILAFLKPEPATDQLRQARAS